MKEYWLKYIMEDIFVKIQLVYFVTLFNPGYKQYGVRKDSCFGQFRRVVWVDTNRKKCYPLRGRGL